MQLEVNQARKNTKSPSISFSCQPWLQQQSNGFRKKKKFAGIEFRGLVTTAEHIIHIFRV